MSKYVTCNYTLSTYGSLSNSFNLRLEGEEQRDATAEEINDLLSRWNEVAAVFPQAKRDQTFDEARDFLNKTKGRGVLWLTIGDAKTTERSES